MAELVKSCVGTPITLFEFKLPRCKHSFGTGLCTATGTPCYNYYNGCKDKCNFEKDCDSPSIWFATCQPPPSWGVNALPVVTDIDYVEGAGFIGEAFETESSVSWKMQDVAHSDQGFDPYWPRGVIPIRKPDDMPGTVLARWIKRFKNFEGHVVCVYQGDCSMAKLCELKRSEFILEDPTGPTIGCQYCFKANDILSLAKDAECPSPDQKFAAVTFGEPFQIPFELGVNLDGVPTENQPNANPLAQIGNPLIVSNVAIGFSEDQDECMACLRHICTSSGEVLEVHTEPNTNIPTGWNVYLDGRGACGSAIQPHEVGEEFTLAKTFPKNMHWGEVIRELIDCTDMREIVQLCCDDETYSVIDQDSLKDFICKNPDMVLGEDVIICEPTPIIELLNQLSGLGLFTIRAKNNKVMIDCYRPRPAAEIKTITTLMIVEDSFAITDADQKRYSTIRIKHGTKDCSKALNKDNLSRTTQYADADTLRPRCERVGWVLNKTNTILTQFLGAESEYLAQTLSERHFIARSCPIRRATFTLSQAQAACFDCNDIVQLIDDKEQAEDGTVSEAQWQIQSITSADEYCFAVSVEEVPFTENDFPSFDCDADNPYTIPTTLTDNQICSGECPRVF